MSEPVALPQEILALITQGATFTVRPHDMLNPGFGYFARIDTPKWRGMAEGDTPEQSIRELVARLRSGAFL